MPVFPEDYVNFCTLYDLQERHKHARWADLWCQKALGRSTFGKSEGYQQSTAVSRDVCEEQSSGLNVMHC